MVTQAWVAISEELPEGNRLLGRVLVEGASPGNSLPVEQVASGVEDGTKTVTTAGTAEPLVASSTPCLSVLITAKRANAGYIYVGGITIESGRGLELPPTSGIVIAIDDLAKLWLDASSDGDGVDFLYVT